MTILPSEKKRIALEKGCTPSITIESNPLASSNPIKIKSKKSKSHESYVSPTSPQSLHEVGSPNGYFALIVFDGVYSETRGRSVSPHIPK